MNVNVVIHAIGACVTGTLVGMCHAQGLGESPSPDARPGQASGNRVVIQVHPGVRIAEGVASLASPACATGADLAHLNTVLGSPAVWRVTPVFQSLGNPQLAHEIGLDRYYVVESAGGTGWVCTQLANLRSVVDSAEPDLIGGEGTGTASAFDTSCKTNADSTNPDTGNLPLDPKFGSQWSLLNTGQSIDGQVGDAGADVGALVAWSQDAHPSGPFVKIAVVDTGVSPNHPDLQGRLIPGFNTIGDPDDTDDKGSSHGTHVAGVIAAVRNNETGIAGLASRVRIMPIRVFNEFGFGFESQFVDGVTWAVDHGADIISMSLGYPTATGLMYDTCMYAHESGVVLIASTGNTAGQGVQYPAKYETTIAVGATDNRDEIWSNSTRGPEITLSAPGVDVVSTWDTPSEPATYKIQTGTSVAVPHVAGTAALLLTVNRDLTPNDIAWVLNTTAKDLGEPGWDEVYGYGRIDAGLAVAGAITLGERGNCRLDFDADGRFSISDVNLFVVLFFEGDARADLAPPFGAFNTSDIQAFVDEVAERCE